MSVEPSWQASSAESSLARGDEEGGHGPHWKGLLGRAQPGCSPLRPLPPGC